MASVHTVKFMHRSPIQMNWLKLNCHRTRTSQKSCIESHTILQGIWGQWLIKTIFDLLAIIAWTGAALHLEDAQLDPRRGVGYPFVFSNLSRVLKGRSS